MTNIGVAARPQADHTEAHGNGASHGERPARVLAWAIRRPILAATVVAFVARLALALVSFQVHRPAFVPDELQYLQLSKIIAKGGTAADWFPGGGDYAEALYRTTWSFTGTLMYLSRLFGPSRLVGQLLAVVCGTVVVALTARLALEFVSRRWALVTGLVVALLPSQVLWSSVAIRESMVWLGLVALALGAVVASRSSSRALVGGTLLGAASLLLLGHLRDQVMVAAAWSFLLAAPLAGATFRLRRSALALAVVVFVPYFGGTGWAGYTYLDHGFGVLAVQRAYLAGGANTAFVPLASTTTTVQSDGDAQATPDPDGSDGTRGTGPPRRVRRSGGSSSGSGSPTSPYPLSGGGFARDLERGPGNVPRSTDDDGEEEDVVYLPRGVYLADNAVTANLAWLPKGAVATLFRPWIWETASSGSMSLARVENLLWLAVYLAAIAGAWIGRREWRRLAIVVGMLVALVAEAAVSQGNLGTAFRHRGQIVWALAILVALAGQAWSDRRARALS